MGGTANRNKRKKRNNSSSISDSESDLENRRQSHRTGGPDNNTLVSEMLCQTHSLLFEEPELLNNAHDNSVFDATKRTVCSKKTVTAEDKTDMVSNKSEPTNGDIMNRLYGIVSRLYTMDKRLNALEERKVLVTVFDNDLKKLWTFVEDKNTNTENKLSAVEDKVEIFAG